MTTNELEKLHDEIFGLLNSLYENVDGFNKFIEKPCEYYWCDAEKEIRNYSDDISFHSGATKGVMVDANLNWVVKIPFLYERHNLDWNCEKQAYERYEWHDLSDYCKIEWRNYAAAVDFNVSECFAQTYYLGDFHNIPIYIQEYLDCDESYVNSRAYDSAYNAYRNEWDDDLTEEEREDEFSDSFYDWDGEEQMESLTYEMWGGKLSERFWNFCSLNDIDDLHTGNWSISGDKLVAVDFSGYGCAPIMNNRGWDQFCFNVVSA